jgi:hypothetical protein
VERDARQQVETLAKRLSAVATRNLFRPAGGDDSRTRLLERVLEGEEAVSPISSLDTRDQKLFRLQAALERLREFVDHTHIEHYEIDVGCFSFTFI